MARVARFCRNHHLRCGCQEAWELDGPDACCEECPFPLACIHDAKMLANVFLRRNEQMCQLRREGMPIKDLMAQFGLSLARVKAILSSRQKDGYCPLRSGARRA